MSHGSLSAFRLEVTGFKQPRPGNLDSTQASLSRTLPAYAGMLVGLGLRDARASVLRPTGTRTTPALLPSLPKEAGFGQRRPVPISRVAGGREATG